MTRIRTTRRTVATVATFAAVAAGATVVGLAGGAPADAAAPHRGKVYFVIGGAQQHPVAIMHGALNAAGKDDPNHDNYDVLKFAHGSIRIVHPQSQAKYVPYLNKKTCYASFTETGAFHLSHGTGRYAGVSGSGRYTANGSAFVPRTKSGACNLNTQPTVEIFTVHAHGTLK
jgi:hypothetical protein